MILHDWVARVAAEEHEVRLSEPLLRNDIPELLDELADWLGSMDAPETSLLASSAFKHVVQRLDSGVALGQLLREYRLLREVIIAHVLSSEAAAQQAADPSPGSAQRGRIVELARLNAGLDVVLSQSMEQFVTLRDQRAGAHAEVMSTRLHKIMNIEGVGVLTFAEDGRLLDANEAFLQMFGYSHEEVSSGAMTWRDLTPQEHIAESERQMQRLERTGRLGPYRKEYLRKDGKRAWLLFAGAALGDGTIVEYCIDVSGEKRSEARYRTLFDSIGQGFCIVQVITDDQQRCTDVHFLEVNPAFEQQTGLLHAADRRASELKPSLVSGWLEACGRVALSGQRERFTSHWKPTDRWFDIEVFRIGEPTECRVALLFSNVTERVQSERRQREADRRKDEFLAVLGHELRNPLAPIRTGLGLLEHARANPALLDSLRPMMHRQVAHLTRLVDDLLDMARVSRGMIELRQSSLDLNHAVEAAIEQVRNVVAERGHALTVKLASQSLPVHGDFERLTQVIANLLSNAVKYTTPGGKIAVRTEIAADRAVIRISDTGYGIPPERLGEVFDMFMQVPEHREMDASSGGLGIGLALAKQLVEMHGGSIEAASEGLGRGSEFIVRLPLSPALGATREPIGPDCSHATHRRVLVVDDNVDAAESLAMLLRLEGHEVDVAHDGARALELLEQTRPDTVLLDIGLPGWDGIEVGHRMREHAAGRSVQLIAVTGWGQQRDRRRTRDAGFDHHLTKPVDPDELFELIQRRRAPAAGRPAIRTG